MAGVLNLTNLIFSFLLFLSSYNLLDKSLWCNLRVSSIHPNNLLNKTLRRDIRVAGVLNLTNLIFSFLLFLSSYNLFHSLTVRISTVINCNIQGQESRVSLCIHWMDANLPTVKSNPTEKNVGFMEG